MTATLDAEQLRALEHPARVTREERVYEEHKPDSFFYDLFHATQRNDSNAWARLRRNQREHDVEQRATRGDTTDTGIGGEFAPPLWAIDKFRLQARAGRVLGDLVTNLVLPPGYQSVHIPKTTTGADVGIQAAQPAPAASVDEVTTDVGANTDVVTIAGHVDASQQLFDLVPAPGYDGIVYKDLTQAYNQRLELQMLAGTGANGQMTGVTKVASVVTVSGAGVSTTQDTMVQNLWTLIGQAAAIVGTSRLIPPDVILMAPRRYYAIASAKDTQNRPLGNVGLLPNITSLPDAGYAPPVDRLLGINTYVTGGIIGSTSTNADYVVVARVEDMLLYESPDHWTINVNPLAGTLGVRLSLHRYAAFINTMPQSISAVLNIPQPTNF